MFVGIKKKFLPELAKCSKIPRKPSVPTFKIYTNSLSDLCFSILLAPVAEVKFQKFN